ncbi:MAG: HNH endonuclease [Chloroflexia bacterium]|nr:HNH endonuclease [Chloroflexia bacterium]
MSITDRSTKILWAAAAGRCSFPDCWERLCIHDSGDASPFTIGEMAHIRGERPKSNRHDPFQSVSGRDDYSNLILLCPTHHTLIDRKENQFVYPVEMIHQWKSSHEARISERMEIDKPPSRSTVASSVLILLTDNRGSWSQYGPSSNIARREPNNGKVYEVWVSERLSTIVPNNRRIVAILEANRGLFEANEQRAISAFLIHAQSYERWVRDEIPYSAVKPFPTEFEFMVGEVAGASI